jgi:hypothetical protein
LNSTENLTFKQRNSAILTTKMEKYQKNKITIEKFYKFADSIEIEKVN